MNSLSLNHLFKDPVWVGKLSWRREWLPTPVLLLGESHGQRCLVGTVRGVSRVTNTLIF